MSVQDIVVLQGAGVAGAGWHARVSSCTAAVGCDDGVRVRR